MLASLLPGFRDVRSALVAGYMWVSAAWLIGAHAWPDLLTRGTDILGEPAVQLLALLGSAGSLVALSVLCLLVGEFTSGTVQRLFFNFSKAYVKRITPENLGDVRGTWLRIFRPMSGRAVNRVLSTTQRAYEKQQAGLAGAAEADQPITSPCQVAISALQEVLFLSPRLIIAKPELYAEYDRVRAESAFRDAILVPLPLLALGVLLNIDLPLWVELVAFATILLIDIYLFFQSRGQFRTAHSMVAHSLADGTITSAAVGDG